MATIQCDNCGYEWDYSGDLWNTTCPRCNGKTSTPLKEAGETKNDPSPAELVAMTIKVDEDRKEEIRMQAAHERRSMSALVREAITDYMSRDQ